jgi:hypothetical protein
MPNFVYDNTSLAFPKTNLFPLQSGADPTKYIVDTNWNDLCQGVVDLRGAIKQGKYFGFAPQASDPNPLAGGTTSWLWVRNSDGQIIHRRPDGSSRELADKNSDLLPSIDATYKLGDLSHRWLSLNVVGLNVDSIANAAGSTALDFSNLAVNGVVVANNYNLVPYNNINTQSLGSPSRAWDKIYVRSFTAEVLAANLTADTNRILLAPGQGYSTLSNPGTALIRYNDSTHKIQVSINGGAYTDITTGGIGTIFYQTLQANAVSRTQRSKTNFSTAFSLTDNAGQDRTDIDIAATFAGAGLTYASGVLDIGQGTGIIVSANTIAVDTSLFITSITGPGGAGTGAITLNSNMLTQSGGTFNWDNGNTKALTDAATITGIDVSVNNAFEVTLNVVGATRAMGAPTNLPAGTRKNGSKITFAIRQDGTGGRAVTWTSGAGGYLFAVGLGPTASDLSTLLANCPINGVVLVGFQYHTGLNRWLCCALAGSYS